MFKATVFATLVASTALATQATAQQKDTFRVAWSIYVGWMPWGYLEESGIMDEWAEKYGIDVEIGGHRVQARVTRSGDQILVHGPNGDLTFTERPRFTLPGSDAAEAGFVARMPGKVIELRVAVGDSVVAGQTVLVLEAMKMEHPVRAAEDGIVLEVCVAEGDQVEAGTVLLVVESSSEESSKEEREEK